MLFGPRSEKLRRQVEEAEVLLKQQEQQSDLYNGREDDPQVPRQLRQSRHTLPDLPREIHRLEPAETCCPECGSDMEYLSEVSVEPLELVFSALKVILIVRVKKACAKCDCIVEAPALSRPIDRGIAEPAGLGSYLKILRALAAISSD
jgi:transposase